MPQSPFHPEAAAREIFPPRSIPHNTGEFGVGRSGKIGIIGLEALRKLAGWMAVRELKPVKGSDSCHDRRIEPPCPPAPAEGHDIAAGTALESGAGQGGAIGCSEDTVTDCSSARDAKGRKPARSVASNSTRKGSSDIRPRDQSPKRRKQGER